MYLSLKESTRGKRGKGVQRKGSGQTKLPGNWIDLLCNGKQLFTFLTSKVLGFTFTAIQAVYAALTETVVSVGNNNPVMTNSNHEEADTRLVQHILHVLEWVLKRIEVCTIDTDVIVIPVGVLSN